MIVSQLADPQWKARWIGLDGQGDVRRRDPAGLPQGRRTRGMAACRGSSSRAAGRYDLEYDARDVVEGAAISTIAWVSWMVWRRSRSGCERWPGDSDAARTETEA